MPAVKASFLRMSATWNALRIVESIGCQFRGAIGATLAERSILALDDMTGATGGLDALARARAEGVGVHGEGLGQLALGENLDRYLLAGTETLGLQQLYGDLGPRLEAGVQIGDVHGLGMRAEHLERH